MKKYLRPQSLSLLSVVLGGLILLCRIWLQQAGIDPNGLYIAGHIADVLSFILLGVGVLGIWLCIRCVENREAGKNLFAPSLPGALGCFIGGMGILLTGILEMRSLNYILSMLLAAESDNRLHCLCLLGDCRLRAAERPQNQLSTPLCRNCVFRDTFGIPVSDMEQ